jgi:hypothetical protein
MNEKIGREELIRMLKIMNKPKKNGLTQEIVEQLLINFCAGCPDPVRARWLIVECLDPMTDDELVDRALSMPFRPMSDVPTSIVPADHPARTTAE